MLQQVKYPSADSRICQEEVMDGRVTESLVCFLSYTFDRVSYSLSVRSQKLEVHWDTVTSPIPYEVVSIRKRINSTNDPETLVADIVEILEALSLTIEEAPFALSKFAYALTCSLHFENLEDIYSSLVPMISSIADRESEFLNNECKEQQSGWKSYIWYMACQPERFQMLLELGKPENECYSILRTQCDYFLNSERVSFVSRDPGEC